MRTTNLMTALLLAAFAASGRPVQAEEGAVADADPRASAEAVAGTEPVSPESDTDAAANAAAAQAASTGVDPFAALLESAAPPDASALPEDAVPHEEADDEGQ